jgi:hypothetical protein
MVAATAHGARRPGVPAGQFGAAAAQQIGRGVAIVAIAPTIPYSNTASRSSLAPEPDAQPWPLGHAVDQATPFVSIIAHLPFFK